MHPSVTSPSEAGVAQGTFYIYFKSRDEVFFELVLEMGRMLTDEALQRGDPGFVFLDQVAAACASSSNAPSSYLQTSNTDQLALHIMPLCQSVECLAR